MGGRVAWHNAPRARLAIGETKDVEDGYELRVVKRNHGRKGQPIILKFHEGALVPLDAVPDDGKAAALRGACIRAALTAADMGSPFTRQRAIPSWAMKEIGAAVGTQATNKIAHDILDAAHRDGELRYMKGERDTMAGFYPVDLAQAEALSRRRNVARAHHV